VGIAGAAAEGFDAHAAKSIPGYHHGHDEERDP
jgi:hypothetical protein